MPAMLSSGVMESIAPMGRSYKAPRNGRRTAAGKAAPARRGKLGTSPVSLEVP